MNFKKFLRKFAYAVLGFCIGGWLLFPYTRQLTFGPAIEGVPLCRLQEDFRRDALGPNFVPGPTDRIAKWLKLGGARNTFESLQAEGRVEVLKSLLDDPDPAVRKRAVERLAANSSRSAAVAPVLALLLDDASPEVKKLAMEGLLSAKNKDSSTVPKIVLLADDPDSGCRILAAQAICLLSDDAQLKVSILEKALRDTDMTVVYRALELLDEIRSVSDVPLSHRVRYPGAQARPWTQLVQFQQFQATPALIGALSHLLDSANPGARSHAARTLADFNDAAKSTLPKINALLGDADPLCRVSAAYAVMRMNPESPEPLAIFRQSLQNQDAPVRVAALEVARRLAPLSNRLFSEIVAFASADGDYDLRSHAVAALGSCGRKAVPHLLELMQTAPAPVLVSCIEALGALGKDAHEAIGELRALVNDPHVGAIAKIALSRIDAQYDAK